MGTNIYGIGVSGLKAAQLSLLTTSHNITNASNAGYHRQTVTQAAAMPQNTGSGFIGTGVEVQSTNRVYNRYLDLQVMQSESMFGYFDSYSSQVDMIDNLITDSGTSLSTPMQNFFSAMQALSATPESVSARQSALSSTNAMVSRLQLLESRVSELRDGVDTQVDSAITTINGLGRQIASLNLQLADMQRSSQAAQPNDLFDKRDQLVAELNKYIKATTVESPNGSIDVFIGNGQSIVSGPNFSNLITAPSDSDPEQLDIFYEQRPPLPNILIASNMLEGGSLGGLLAFRDEILTTAQNSLGRIAISIADQMNQQHQKGIDLSGNPGTALFSVSGPRVVSNANNTGNAVLSAVVTNTGQLSTSDYQVSFDGTNYNVLRLSDKTTTSYATLPQTLDGVTISISSGAMNTGDLFLVQPTRVGAKNLAVLIDDPRELALAAPMRSAASNANKGTATISAGTVTSGLPLNANLTQPVTITFTSATTFDVTGTGTGNPTGVAYTTGGTISYNGWSVEINGNPKPGDTFTMSINASGVSDNRNLLKMIDLQVAPTLNNNTTNFQAAYGQLVSQIGNSAQEMQVNSAAQEVVVTQSRAAQNSFSGVNLDEEAANLLKFQQAYQASAKIMKTASEMFATLLDLAN